MQLVKDSDGDASSVHLSRTVTQESDVEVDLRESKGDLDVEKQWRLDND
jgi:hypothetical protein